jgi:hypothetical protein
MRLGVGESGQYILTRRKRKFGITTNGPPHGSRLLARIFQQVVSIIFSRKVMGTGRQLEILKELLSAFIERFMALSKVFSSLSSGLLDGGGELIFMSDSR